MGKLEDFAKLYSSIDKDQLQLESPDEMLASSWNLNKNFMAALTGRPKLPDALPGEVEVRDGKFVLTESAILRMRGETG